MLHVLSVAHKKCPGQADEFLPSAYIPFIIFIHSISKIRAGNQLTYE